MRKGDKFVYVFPSAPRPVKVKRMHRTDRLLSILLELKASRWSRAADLADLFEVSTRTIYRDMQVLGEAGVPLTAVPGKGYSLNESYFLPPLPFTSDEAMLLLLGSDFMAQHFEVHYRRAARTAALKIEAVLPEELRETAAALKESIRFVPVNVFDNPSEQAALRTLRRALAASRVVRFRTSSRGSAERTIEPYGLVHRADGWYLLGRDRAEACVRHFRLVSMAGLDVLDETFERPAAYRAGTEPADEPREIVVEVLFDEAAAAWVHDTPSFFVEDRVKRPDGLLVTLRVRREAEVLPWLLGWGAHARVLAPASLRRRLAAEAEKIAAQYREEPMLLL